MGKEHCVDFLSAHTPAPHRQANRHKELKMAMSKTALGKAIADLIIDEVKKSTITVAAGISVATTGSATSQTGATTSTGTATIE